MESTIGMYVRQCPYRMPGMVMEVSATLVAITIILCPNKMKMLKGKGQEDKRSNKVNENNAGR